LPKMAEANGNRTHLGPFDPALVLKTRSATRRLSPPKFIFEL
jgi:hypothetical protein